MIVGPDTPNASRHRLPDLKQIFHNIVSATQKAGRFLVDNIPTAISYLEKYGPTIAKYAPLVLGAAV